MSSGIFSFMKEIPLTQGFVAIVDDEDYSRVSQFKWYVMKRRRSVHAGRTIRRPDGGETTRYLHKEILSTAARVDHRDGNGLNNRRENLRAATTKQNNQAFQLKRKNTTSKFRGVSLNRRDSRWWAQIQVNGKNRLLGRFTHEEDAARAYDKAAREHFGDFAAPNFPI